MNRAILLAALALTCLVGVQAGAASAQDVSGLRIDRVDVAGHPDVRVTVSAPASGGDDSFAIVEDGEDRAFTVEDASSADLQVVLLLDVTGSMGGGALDAAKDAAIAFLEGLPDEANVAVVSYDTDAEVVSGFDGTRDEHVTAIEALEAAGETAMYDAVVTALDVFPATEDATRALVLLTDGEDNASVTELDTVIDRLSSSGVLLRGVEYQTAYSETAGIRAMAEATGGDVVEADDPGALVGVYERLAAELTNRYTLSYGSKAAGTVELTVELTSGDETARASQRIELPAAPRVTEDRVDEEPIEAVVPPPSVEPAEPSTRVVTYTWLIVGALLFFAGLAGMLVILFSPRARRAQLAGSAARISRGRGSAHELAGQVTALASRTLEQRGYQRGLNAALERAGIQLRPEEFVVLVGSIVVTAFAVGLALSGSIAGLVLAALVVIGARLYVSIRRDRRQAKFSEQLSDTLQLLAGSMRAGYSLMQAIDAVAREADAPTSEEFSRLVVETRLGRSTHEALDAMAERMGGDDLRWVTQAIEIHREVGGDLAEVLDNVSGTIRERNQIRRQVQALSAEGRLSGWVLLALPFGVGGFIFLTNRPYLAELTASGLGWSMLAIGTLLLLAGGLWIRNLVKLQF
jgi:tight adherence protein B